MSDRYDALTGGDSGRNIYYALVRRLRVLPTEFDALPWHYQRMLVEKLDEELQAEQDEAEENGAAPRRQKVNALGDLSSTPFKVSKAQQHDT